MLCLSGGGYRAALFHLGALTRLNELGLLAQTETVGAIAGGSILAALLAARLSWPLRGPCRDWSEGVAEPMRAIARRSVHARPPVRRSISGTAAEAVLEERYARQLADSLGPKSEEQPRLVFGGAGLALGEMGDSSDSETGGLRWELADSVGSGYDRELIADLTATTGADLRAVSDGKIAVLENHGYLLAEAAARSVPPRGLVAIEPPAEPPHPAWMDERRAREALQGSSRRGRLGRLPWRRDTTEHFID